MSVLSALFSYCENNVLATMKKINAVLDRIRTAADCFLPHPASDNSAHMELDDITDLGMLVVPVVPRAKMQSYVVLLSLLNILVFLTEGFWWQQQALLRLHKVAHCLSVSIACMASTPGGQFGFSCLLQPRAS